MNTKWMTDHEWLLSQGINANDDELYDFIERVGKFHLNGDDDLEEASIKAMGCMKKATNRRLYQVS